MHPVAVTLNRADPASSHLTAETVTDPTWIHHRREDRLDHLRARVDLDHCRIAAAIIAASSDAATASPGRVCERALRHTPTPRGRRLALT
ncbi:hypothetical protein ABT095_00175 [Kitasatospora sp. NPDC002227]|uniref:hypothetical protein n=1 Tax=Kitasatospora sp. NPDC002227 TaxID=3154773 RepID=UPI003333ACA5